MSCNPVVFTNLEAMLSIWEEKKLDHLFEVEKDFLVVQR